MSTMLQSLTLALALVSTTSQPSAEAVSVCAVGAQPEQFNGKLVLVAGTVLPSRHGISLIDSNCPGVQIAMGSSASDAPGSANDKFYGTYFANYGSSGHAISATASGVFVYIPAQWPVRRLDDYQVETFQLTSAKSP